MTKDKVNVENMSPLDVYVTKNVAIYRQLGMWTDLHKTYTFVPASYKGYVYLVKPGQDGRYELMQGYTLYRPCGLELTWHTDRVVVFHEATKIDAIETRVIAPKKSWRIIGKCTDGDDGVPF